MSQIRRSSRQRKEVVYSEVAEISSEDEESNIIEAVAVEEQTEPTKKSNDADTKKKLKKTKAPVSPGSSDSEDYNAAESESEDVWIDDDDDFEDISPIPTAKKQRTTTSKKCARSTSGNSKQKKRVDTTDEAKPAGPTLSPTRQPPARRKKVCGPTSPVAPVTSEKPQTKRPRSPKTNTSKLPNPKPKSLLPKSAPISENSVVPIPTGKCIHAGLSSRTGPGLGSSSLPHIGVRRCGLSRSAGVRPLHPSASR